MKKTTLLFLCSITFSHAAETQKLLVNSDQPPAYGSDDEASSSRGESTYVPAPTPHTAIIDPRELTMKALRDNALGVIDKMDVEGTVNLVNSYLQDTAASKRDIMRALGACSLAAAQDHTGQLDYHLSTMLSPDAQHDELCKYNDNFEKVGKLRKLTHKEYLALAAQKGWQQAQTDFQKHFADEQFNAVVQHPIHQAFTQIVNHRNEIPAKEIYKFTQDSLLTYHKDTTVFRSELRALGLAYYLTHAYSNEPYGLDLFSNLALTSVLMCNLKNKQKLVVTKKYYDQFPNPVSCKRHSWALENNGDVVNAFKEMRMAALCCDRQACQETSRLGNIVGVDDTKCCFSTCCCCYTYLSCCGGCICEDKFLENPQK